MSSEWLQLANVLAFAGPRKTLRVGLRLPLSFQVAEATSSGVSLVGTVD